MKLKDIIKGIDCEVRGEAELEVKDLQFDSRKVSAGTLFVAQRGTKVDGHDFIVKAMEAGAVAVVCEEIPATQSLSHSVTYIKVKDSSNKDTGLYDALVEGIYDRDPEQYMFWPIYNDTMTNSQGRIKNDYGYESL